MESCTKNQTGMSPIMEINESEFEEKVLHSELPVLVTFWANWSEPCQILEPVLTEVASQCKGRARILKVNADDNPDLGLWFGIHSIPTLLIFADGKVNGRIVGTTSKHAILEKLDLVPDQKKAAKL